MSPAAADRAVGVVVRALEDEGPLPRAALAERMGTEGQATPHLLMLAALRGRIVVAGERFALARDVLGAEPPTALAGEDRDIALGELARRYLAGHAPATDADLAHWSGLPLRDARAGLALAGRVAPVDAGARAAAAAGRVRPVAAGLALARARGAAEHGRTVHPGGGMVRAATADGTVVGTGRRRRASWRSSPSRRSSRRGARAGARRRRRRALPGPLD